MNFILYKNMFHVLASAVQTYLNSMHLPDMSPPYFCLCGYLKDNVYQGKPQSIDDLKTAIAVTIRSITAAGCVVFKSCMSNSSLHRRDRHVPKPQLKRGH